MKLGTLNAHISLCNHGVIKYNFGDGVKSAETDEIKFALKQIYNYFRKTNVSEEQKSLTTMRKFVLAALTKNTALTLPSKFNLLAMTTDRMLNLVFKS